MALDPDVITEAWLRASGFKWGKPAPDREKHWTLWLDSSIAMFDGHQFQTELGIELAKFSETDPSFKCWYRSDLAGRYARFIFVREVWLTSQVTRLVESLTDSPWDPSRSLYGRYRTVEEAAKLDALRDRLDWKIAEASSKMGYGDADASEQQPKY